MLTLTIGSPSATYSAFPLKWQFSEYRLLGPRFARHADPTLSTGIVARQTTGVVS